VTSSLHHAPARRALAALTLAACGASAMADVPVDHWASGEPRLFLSGGLDLGTSEHTFAAAGFGKPHLLWGGLIAHGWLTTDLAAGRVGVKVDVMAAALEAGVRWSRSFRHLPLPDTATQDELPSRHGFVSRVLDLSLSGGLPAGPGFVIYEVLGVRLLSSHGEVQLYDELLRIVYRPPWLATASAGWVASLRGGALLVGGRAQWAFETGRSGDPFVRAGPVAYWRPWPHLALAGELLFPVSNPDDLGFQAPIVAYVVLSFTAATGTPPPRFP